MNKYKKLVNNSIVFAIGNFGSKIISLVMVPLYTFVLSPSQYGEIDLITTTASLLMPILSLSIGEAVIRFVMVDTTDKTSQKSILSNSILLNVSSQVLFFAIAYPILKYFNVFGNQLLLFFILLFLIQIQQTFAQFTRGIGAVKSFALNGILMTIVTASLNILFLVNLKMGLDGYLWSLILANFISIIYLLIATKCLNKISFKYINLNIFKSMASYSIPLIPNMIMWWVISGSTRYFILFFLGTNVNGLFAVANKIPSILSMFTTIFQQAWQLSAFEEYKSKESKEFFSKVFTLYSQFVFIGCSIMMLFVKIVIPKLINIEYFNSWQIMPFLLMGVVYQSFSSFIGTNYTASMKTKGVFISSLLGGLVSVMSNLIFIPILGLTGTGIGTFLSFFVMFVYRYIDTKKTFHFTIQMNKFVLSNVILFIQIILLFVMNSVLLLIFMEIILILMLCYLNKSLFVTLYSALHRKNNI